MGNFFDALFSFVCSYFIEIFKLKNTSKKITHHDQVSSISEMQGWFSKYKSINIIYHINRWKERNYMIISLNSEKAVVKIKYFILIRVLGRLDRQRTYLNTIQVIYTKFTNNLTLSGWKYRSFTFWLGKRQECHVLCGGLKTHIIEYLILSW